MRHASPLPACGAAAHPGVDVAALVGIADAAQPQHQRLPGQHPARFARQRPEHLEFHRGQGHLGAALPGQALLAVDDQFAECQPMRRQRRPIAPAQQRAYPRQQHMWRHGPHHIVVGARVQGLDLRLAVADIGEHQDRHGREGAQIAADFQPIPAGRRRVQHHDLGAMPTKRLDGQIAATDLRRVEIVLREKRRHPVGLRQVAGDEQDLGHGKVRRQCRAPAAGGSSCRLSATLDPAS